MHYLTGEILTLACVHEKLSDAILMTSVWYITNAQACHKAQPKCCAKNKASESVIFTNNSHVYSRMYSLNNDKADCIFGIQQCRSSKGVLLEKLHIITNEVTPACAYVM